MDINAFPIPCPTGVYVVRGWRIPVDLLYVYDDERDLDTARHCGEAIAKEIARRAGRIFRTRTFASEAECQAAIDAARERIA